ncbi:sulfotransferase domain-containing protein [Actinomadura sp. 9N215]|uniref:sulfotransferase domain-containing protein n=1 Tax=Actinomadura sp. 9N215 TaxID=3375150 RepID=UPI003792F440
MLDTARSALSLFFEMSESNEQAMAARLSAAGFDDITLGDVLLLAALQMRGRSAPGSRPKPKIDRAVSREMTDKLFLRGYLEDRSAPHHPDRTVVALTSRGRSAVEVATDGVLADRWASFPFRPGDIVISAPRRSGAALVQTICALLIFQTPHLPAPLSALSPWLDDPGTLCHEVFGQYAAQRHRRFIKTHSPLSAIPSVPEVTYIAIGRKPLDIAWLAAGPGSPAKPSPLLGVLRHVSDAWARRAEPNVVLMHYDDLFADLEGQLRLLAARLGITVSDDVWSGLVKAATLEQMYAAEGPVEPFPNHPEDDRADVRKGAPESGAAPLTGTELADYHARVAEVLEPDVLAWLGRVRSNEHG